MGRGDEALARRVVVGASAVTLLLLGGCDDGNSKRERVQTAAPTTVADTSLPPDATTTTAAPPTTVTEPAPTTAVSTAAATTTTVARPATSTTAARPAVTAAPSPTPTPPPTSAPAPTTTTTSPPATRPETSIEIVNNAYAPAALTIRVGTTVVAHNADAIAHTWTANDAAWDSGTMGPGATYSFTFNQPGTFSYVCTLHKRIMQGSVTVST